MGKTIILTAITILILGCGTKRTSQEQYHLPIQKDKLVHIMIDLAIAESAAASYRVNLRDSVRNVYRYQLEKVHNVSITKIDSTLELLYENTLLNQELQKRVIDSLKHLEEIAKQFEK